MTVSYADAEARFLMPTYRRYPVALARGEGTRLYDEEGREYLDFAGGIAAVPIGHSHPRWVAAVREQAARLVHVSNLFYTEPQVRLAERLTGLTGTTSLFLANSGAEANEAALKLARRRTGRPTTVAALGSFHGRTLATLAATGQPEKHAPFGPLPERFVHVPFGDPEALAAAVDGETAAVLLEPVLGEGGVIPAPPGYLAAARAVCDDAGALLVLDEIQTGVGRTGAWLACQREGVVPDVVTLAKGLAGGLPIGACLARDGVAFGPGEHASTFGGGPVSCAAALAVLDVIEGDRLLDNARAQGDRLLAALRASLEGHPSVTEVRGAGLLVGVELAEGLPPGAVVLEMIRRGVLGTEAGPRVVRLSPPLTVAPEEVDRAAETVAAAVTAAGEVAPEGDRAPRGDRAPQGDRAPEGERLPEREAAG